jgi:hypothetical protein
MAMALQASRLLFRSPLFTSQARYYALFSGSSLLTPQEVASALQDAPQTEEGIRRALIKELWKKEILQRRGLKEDSLRNVSSHYLFSWTEEIQSLSAEDRKEYLETEGMPTELLAYHMRVKEVYKR